MNLNDINNYTRDYFGKNKLTSALVVRALEAMLLKNFFLCKATLEKNTSDLSNIF